MTALRIRVRESSFELPLDTSGHLVVDVPQVPLKVDRGTVIFPWPPGAERRSIVKVYSQMGIFNWLRKQVVGYRARREFRTLGRLRALGLDCCEPVFWGTGRSREHGIFEVVATREIRETVTLAERIKTFTDPERAEILGKVFEAGAHMHRAGIFHGAFFLTNVLVRTGPGAGAVPWLIDLERSIVFGGDIRGSRMADFDLFSIVTSIFAVMGPGHARGALRRYGLDEPEIARVLRVVSTPWSSKFKRYRRRAEFLARGVFSRLAADRAWKAAAGAPID